MIKNIRRKGQGKTQRPVCKMCEKDLDRVYVRKSDGKKRAYIPFGWVCIDCHVVQWD